MTKNEAKNEAKNEEKNAQAATVDAANVPAEKKAQVPAAAPVPERVGEMLRRVRLEKYQDLDDVASYLCIRVQFLKAIEEGDLKELPGETYASGFIRSYAAFLGLDPGETDARYKAEIQTIRELKRKASEGETEVETVAPDNKIIFISLGLLIALYAGWEGYSRWADRSVSVREQPVEEAVFEPQNPYPVDNVTTVDGVYTGVSESASFADVPVAAHAVLESAATHENVPPVPPKKPEQTTAAADVAEPVSETQANAVFFEQDADAADLTAAVQEPVAVETPVVKKPRYPRTFGVKNTDARIVLQAVQDAWIEVTRGDEVVLSRVLYQGDRYRVPADSEDLYLKTGNAGGLEVHVDGRLMPPLGRVGATKSKIALDADAFIDALSEED